MMKRRTRNQLIPFDNPKEGVNYRNTSSNLFEKISKKPLYTALRSVRNSIISNESCYNQQLLTL
jgi:hypothetical protein